MTNGSTKEHAVTDPSHRVSNTFETPPSTRLADARSGMVRPMLWTLLMIGVVCNIVTSTSDLNVFIGIGFGMIVLACAAALVTHHYLHRR
ncbi:hypothetical protein [Streptosporangium sp. NPDC049304]|uniref:hypothetical protein n=1 Tax=Streptosporangium sp. NPDC049304 TaxID=3154830 RepID=UPI00342EB3E3